MSIAVDSTLKRQLHIPVSPVVAAPPDLAAIAIDDDGHKNALTRNYDDIAPLVPLDAVGMDACCGDRRGNVEWGRPLMSSLLRSGRHRFQAALAPPLVLLPLLI